VNGIAEYNLKINHPHARRLSPRSGFHGNLYSKKIPARAGNGAYIKLFLKQTFPDLTITQPE